MAHHRNVQLMVLVAAVGAAVGTSAGPGLRVNAGDSEAAPAPLSPPGAGALVEEASTTGLQVGVFPGHQCIPCTATAIYAWYINGHAYNAGNGHAWGVKIGKTNDAVPVNRVHTVWGRMKANSPGCPNRQNPGTVAGGNGVITGCSAVARPQGVGQTAAPAFNGFNAVSNALEVDACIKNGHVPNDIAPPVSSDDAENDFGNCANVPYTEFYRMSCADAVARIRDCVDAVGAQYL